MPGRGLETPKWRGPFWRHCRANRRQDKSGDIASRNAPAPLLVHKKCLKKPCGNTLLFPVAADFNRMLRKRKLTIEAVAGMIFSNPKAVTLVVGGLRAGTLAGSLRRGE